MFQTNVVEKSNILRSVSAFRKSCLLCDNAKKYSSARDATDNNMVHAHLTREI